MHFGEYPRVTLKDARELHFAARKLLGTGINPVADRKAEVETKQMAVEAEQRQADNSFEKIAREWWSWWSVGKSPRHAETVLRRLETDAFLLMVQVHRRGDGHRHPEAYACGSGTRCKRRSQTHP